MSKKSDLVRKGLYTDARGRTVVYLWESYRHYGVSETTIMVEYENVRTGKVDELSKEKFLKKFPHRIDRIQVEFSD